MVGFSSEPDHQSHSQPQFGGAKFHFGQVYMTAGARDSVEQGKMLELLDRHIVGDWGDMCEEDKVANDQALQHGGRLFSSYDLSDNLKVYIITEADRSITTILLPPEY